jgi:hypothetical protein
MKLEGKFLKNEIILLKQECSLKKFPDVMRRIAVERSKRGWPESMPLADHTVLQRDQADPETGGLSGAKFQRGAMAGLYVLLRYPAFLLQWGHNFTQLARPLPAVPASLRACFVPRIPFILSAWDPRVFQARRTTVYFLIFVRVYFGFRNQPPLPRRLVPNAFAGVCPEQSRQSQIRRSKFTGDLRFGGSGDWF